MTHVVAFTGPAGCGKSTAADALEEVGFARVKFAAPLKAMLRAFYGACGLTEDEIERRIEGDLKEEPCALLGGKTPRFAMQTLGTEWGRVMIAPDLWVNAWANRAANEIEGGRRVVCDDCRFENEAEAIHTLDGKIVEITGRSKGIGEHVSEKRDFAPDMQLTNKGTQAELKGAAIYIFGVRDYDQT